MTNRISRSITVNPELLERVRAKAKKSGKTLPDVLEMIMLEYLSELKNPLKPMRFPGFPEIPEFKMIRHEGSLDEKIAHWRQKLATSCATIAENGQVDNGPDKTE